jgi:hypothetical protein
MRSDTACSRSNAPEIAPARRRLAENPPSNAHPVVTPWWPPPLYLTYTTFTLSHSQESPGSVESGAGWVCGLLGVQPGVGATTGGPIPAIFMVGTWFVENPAVGGDFSAP